MRLERYRKRAILVAGMLLLASCRPSDSAALRPSESPTSIPITRELTVTTVPLLVKEMAHLLPFLPPDFAPGGVLEGKEVYAFMPSHFTVVEGDTLHFTFINPEDDVHSFVLPGFAVPLPGQTITRATYLAARPGIFTFTCSVPTHLPMMRGELVVIPRATWR